METYEYLSMYETVAATAKKYPFKKSVYYQGRQFSYRTFLKKIDRMADILSNELNIKPHDVILVAQPNIPDMLILIFAINKIGAIVNLVHPFTPFNQVMKIMNETKTKYAFLFEQRVAKEVELYREISHKIFVTRIEDHLPVFKKVFYHLFMNGAIRKKLGKWRNKFRGFHYVHQLKSSGPHVEAIKNKSKDVSIYLHSGSTTGAPKTICLCDANFNYIAEHSDYFMSTDDASLVGQGVISFLPSFHGFGYCMTMYLPLTHGMNCILMPKYSAKELVSLMNKTRVNVLLGVPTMYENLLDYSPFVNSKKIKYLNNCFCGGDTLSSSLEERYNLAMKNGGSNSRILEGYGLTEAVAAISINTLKKSKKGSLGYPIPGTMFRIVDENGYEVEKGEIGEITTKTPAMMVGYLNGRESTNEAIKDGWLFTGDLGYMNKDGFLFFASRKKRVIKVSGVGVFPSEIESLINHVPGVKECSAIRIPDDRLQSAVKVFVVASYYDEHGMKELILERCRKYLIRWAVPKEIEFVDSLPRTMLNKIDFNRLQKEEDKKRGIDQ